MGTLKRILLVFAIINYVLIWVGGNLCYSKNIFTLQKRIARIMVAAKPRSLCRGLFKRPEIVLILYE
jgi:hypothetical protein